MFARSNDLGLGVNLPLLEGSSQMGMIFNLDKATQENCTPISSCWLTGTQIRKVLCTILPTINEFETNKFETTLL